MASSDLYMGKSNGAVRSPYFHGLPSSTRKLVRLSPGISHTVTATVHIMMAARMKMSRQVMSSFRLNVLIVLYAFDVGLRLRNY